MTPGLWRTARLVIVLAVVVGLGALASAAQPTPPVARQPVLEQRVHDLKEYREFLEEQLAAAKAVIAEQRQQLETCRQPQDKP